MEEKPGSREYSVMFVRNLGTKVSKIISQLQILIQSPGNKAIMIQGILEAERGGLGISNRSCQSLLKGIPPS